MNNRDGYRAFDDESDASEGLSRSKIQKMSRSQIIGKKASEEEVLEATYGVEDNRGFWCHHQVDVQAFMEDMESPWNVFKRVYQHEYTLDVGFRVAESDWQESENKYEYLIEAWNDMVAGQGLQFGHTETDFEDYPRVQLESPYSTVAPYYHFLKHEDDEVEPYDFTKNGYQIKMFEHLSDKLPGLSESFEEICEKFRPVLEEAKIEPEQIETEDGAKKLEPYYMLDQSGYRLVSFPGVKKKFAIQTVYDRKENAHRLVFYRVESKDGEEEEQQLVEQKSFEVRRSAQEVKCWLTNQLVTYKLVGHFVLFFQLEFVGEDDEDVWQYKLIKYDLLTDEEDESEPKRFTCSEAEEYYDGEEEKFEALAVMIADKFGSNKRDSKDVADLSVEDHLKELQFIILEGVVAPEPSMSIDILKQAKFHFRKWQDADDADDLLEVDMEAQEPMMDPSLCESHINIQQPLKFFYMSEEDQIDDIRLQAGIIKKGQKDDEDDDDQAIPAIYREGDAKLFFICGFNNGTKGPLDFSDDQLLPDVFKMFYTIEPYEKDSKLIVKEIDLIAHREGEKPSSDINFELHLVPGIKKLHKKINEAIQNLECHNSSTESWFDRARKQNINQMRTLCRSENECFKKLIQNQGLPITQDDKIYLGQGKWNDQDGDLTKMMKVNCAVNSNKYEGTLTILMSILQDTRPENVIIRTIETPTWYLSNDKTQTSYGKNIESSISVDFQDPEVQDPFACLMTFSRYSSYMSRFHDKLLFHRNNSSESIADPDLNFTPLIGQSIFVDTAKQSADLEQILAPNIQKAIEEGSDTPFMVFARNLGIINEVMYVDKESSQKTMVKEIGFSDRVTRDRLKPQQVVFVEDRQPFFPCVAYNVENKQIKDVAFVMLKADEGYISDASSQHSLDLQFGNIDILEQEQHHLFLTVSSEMKEGKRPRTLTLNKDDTKGIFDTVEEPQAAESLIEDTPIVAQEFYFSQRYQIAAVDYTINAVSIVEVDVKFTSYARNPFAVNEFSVTPAGYKRVVLDFPREVFVTLQPLFMATSERQTDGEDGRVQKCYKIVGSKLTVTRANISDEEYDDYDEEDEGGAWVTQSYDFINPNDWSEGEYPYSCKNKFTNSQLREIRDGYEGVIAQTWLQNELIQMSNCPFLEGHEMLRILSNANVVTLNMKLIDLPEFINCQFLMNRTSNTVQVKEIFKDNLKRMFSALELYNGHSIAEIQADNKKMEDYLRLLRRQFKKDEFGFDWLNSAFVDKFCLNSFEKAIRSFDHFENLDALQKGYKKLIKKGLYVDKEVIRFTINMQSLIQLRIEQGDQKSAGNMAQFLQEVQADMTNKYQQLMASMPGFLEHEGDYPYAFEIFSDLGAEEDSSEDEQDSDDSDEDLKEAQVRPVRFRIEIPGKITGEKHLPASLNQEAHSESGDMNKSCSRFIDYQSDEGLREFASLYTAPYVNDDKDKFPVGYSVVIFRDYFVSKQVSNALKSKTADELQKVQLNKFGFQSIAELLDTVLNMNANEIEDNSIVRDLIDSIFGLTRMFNIFMMCTYLVFHCIPLVLVIFYIKGAFGTIICTLLMLFIQMFRLFFEYMDMRQNEEGFRGYIKELSNVVDLTNLIVFLFWAFTQILYPESFLPDEDLALRDMDLQNTDYFHYLLRLIMPLLNTLIVALTFLQLMFYFRTYPEFGVFVTLIQECVGQLWTFAGFLTLWIFCFTLLYRLLGTTFDEEQYAEDYNPDFGDYPKVPSILVGLIQNFRNSVGDLATPHYKYWEARYDGEERAFSQVMILIIWVLWIIQVYLMVIILTNFLIALVSQIYEQIMGQKTLAIYKARSTLNQETVRYMEFIGGRDHSDCMIIANGSVVKNSNNQEWAGMVSAMKKSISGATTRIQKDMKKNKEVNEKKFDALEEETRDMKAMMKQSIELLSNSKVGKQAQKAKSNQRKNKMMSALGDKAKEALGGVLPETEKGEGDGGGGGGGEGQWKKKINQRLASLDEKIQQLLDKE